MCTIRKNNRLVATCPLVHSLKFFLDLCGYMHDFIVQHRPNLMFIHFDSIDEAGHAHQWGSPDYYAAAKVCIMLLAIHAVI